jgi:predicted HTH domain antitoxin
MQNVSLAIPDDIIFEVSALPGQERAVSEKLKRRLAIGMFVSQEISLAKAAELAGQPIVEFIDTLRGLGIAAFRYTDEMLVDDLRFATGA